MSSQIFVMSPVFSPYQTLESFIVQLSVKNAYQEVTGNTPIMQNIMNNTPYLLYQIYGLYNPSRSLVLENPGGTPVYPNMSLGQQQLYLITAFVSVALYLATTSDLVFINGNGPVVNSGFTAILGTLNTLGIPVTYWKDDSRHLWGFNDNPLSIGLMPSVNRQLLEPARLDIRLTKFSINSGGIKCGASTLNERISNTIKSYGNISKGSVSSIIQNKISLGKALYDSVNGNFLPSADRTDNIRNMADLWKKLYTTMSANLNLLSPDDQQFVNQYRNTKLHRSFPLELQGMAQGTYNSVNNNLEVSHILGKPTLVTYPQLNKIMTMLTKTHEKINNF